MGKTANMGEGDKALFSIMEDITINSPLQQIHSCQIGVKTKIYHFVNLYGCSIGNNCTVGSFVEIQNHVKIGDNVKISSHTFVCEGVTIEDNVFLGHHVVFTNDKYPRATNKNGKKKEVGEWTMARVLVKKGASIGSNATILPGITIGENAMIGAGSVVTKDVLANQTVVGNPAKPIEKRT